MSLTPERNPPLPGWCARPTCPATTRPTTPAPLNRRLIGPDTVGSRHVEVLLGVIEKGQGALPHAHPGIEQVCYLLSGTARAQVADEWADMAAGDCCYFPPDVPHVFTVTSDQPARLLVIYTPPYEESPNRVIRGFPAPPPPDAAPCRPWRPQKPPAPFHQETSHETIAPAGRRCLPARPCYPRPRSAPRTIPPPITLIVPFPAGSGTDAVGRIFGNELVHPGPAGHRREQARRQRHHRRQSGGARPPRLHDLRHHQHLALGRALADEERALRPREGLHAHRARRQPALHPGRQPQTALENGRRPGRRCAPAPGAHHLCQRQQHRHRGRRHAGPPRQYRHPARAL